MPPIGKKPPVINPFQQQPQELQIEYYRAVSASGQSALKGLLIMNGGAAIALLAFLGTVAGREGVPPEYVAAIAPALRLFLFGVFLSVGASATTYLSNLVQSIGWRRVGIGLLIFTVIVGAGALAVFLWGGWIAADAITSRGAFGKTVC